MISINNYNRLTVDIKPIVIIKKKLNVVGYDNLPISIHLDFTNIPKEQHEELLNIVYLTYQ